MPGVLAARLAYYDPDADVSEMLNADDAAVYFHREKSYLLRLARAGRMPCVVQKRFHERTGRQYYCYFFRKEDLDAWGKKLSDRGTDFKKRRPVGKGRYFEIYLTWDQQDEFFPMFEARGIRYDQIAPHRRRGRKKRPDDTP